PPRRSAGAPRRRRGSARRRRRARARSSRRSSRAAPATAPDSHRRDRREPSAAPRAPARRERPRMRRRPPSASSTLPRSTPPRPAQARRATGARGGLPSPAAYSQLARCCWGVAPIRTDPACLLREAALPAVLEARVALAHVLALLELGEREHAVAVGVELLEPLEHQRVEHRRALRF